MDAGELRSKMIREQEGEKYTLIGVDGNAYAIMGYVVKAMKKEGRSPHDIEKYRTDAILADYDHLLRVSMDMIDDLNKVK